MYVSTATTERSFSAKNYNYSTMPSEHRTYHYQVVVIVIWYIDDPHPPVARDGCRVGGGGSFCSAWAEGHSFYVSF